MQTDLKNLDILEKAKGLWPSSTPDQLALLTKIFSNVECGKALDILEDVKTETRYNSIPFPDIKRRAGMAGASGRLGGSDIECWAVHSQSGYTYNCMVSATNDDGAKCMMEKYLTNRCRVDPTWYTLFIGENSQGNAVLYRGGLN